MFAILALVLLLAGLAAYVLVFIGLNAVAHVNRGGDVGHADAAFITVALVVLYFITHL